MSNFPRLCVAIPTLDRGILLRECLENLFSQQPPADEIVVVDQTVEHPSEIEAYLADVSRRGKIRYFRTVFPNLPRARNQAILASGCEIVVFIDEDVFLPPGFIQGHRSYYRDGKFQAVCGEVYENRASAIPVDTFRALCRDPQEREKHRVFRWGVGALVDSFRGANFSARREVLMELGGADESFAGTTCWGEDEDLAMRLVAAGYRIADGRDAWLVHFKAPSGGTRNHGKQKRNPEWTEAAAPLLMYFRHGSFGGDRSRKWLPTLFYLLRRGPLRRINLVRPWRLPFASLAFVRALVFAWRNARGGTRSLLFAAPVNAEAPPVRAARRS